MYFKWKQFYLPFIWLWSCITLFATVKNYLCEIFADEKKCDCSANNDEWSKSANGNSYTTQLHFMIILILILFYFIHCYGKCYKFWKNFWRLKVIRVDEVEFKFRLPKKKIILRCWVSTSLTLKVMIKNLLVSSSKSVSSCSS